MNPVTPEQLAAAHQAEQNAWREFYDYDMRRRDEKYNELFQTWQDCSLKTHRLEELFRAQKLLSEQP